MERREFLKIFPAAAGLSLVPGIADAKPVGLIRQTVQFDINRLEAVVRWDCLANGQSYTVVFTSESSEVSERDKAAALAGLEYELSRDGLTFQDLKPIQGIAGLQSQFINIP